jgi:hypothetical protein
MSFGSVARCFRRHRGCAFLKFSPRCRCSLAGASASAGATQRARRSVAVPLLGPAVLSAQHEMLYRTSNYINLINGIVPLGRGRTMEMFKIAARPLNGSGDPSRIRTCNPRSRNPLLYPVELWDRPGGSRPRYSPYWLSLSSTANMKNPLPRQDGRTDFLKFATKADGGP